MATRWMVPIVHSFQVIVRCIATEAEAVRPHDEEEDEDEAWSRMNPRMIPPKTK